MDARVETQLAVIRELQAYARSLIGRIPTDLAAQIVRLAVERGTAAAAEQLGLSTGMPRTSDITATHVDALALVAQDLGSAFDQLHLRILRYPINAVGAFIGTDIYQQVIARYVPLNLTGALSTDEVRKRALSAFLEEGIDGFTDRIGRRWRIGSYTEMATRSAIGRAYNDASVARFLRSNYRFASVLGNNDACPLCAAWFGKVLSIDGTNPGTHPVPHPYLDDQLVQVTVDATLDDARRRGLMHPNCACSLVGYLPGLSVPVSAPKYDPTAESGREAQRSLERRLRDLKRRAAIRRELNPFQAGALQARIRETQKRLRELTAATGQKRRYDREAVRWADGPSGRPTRPPVVPVVPGPGAGTLEPSPNRARLEVTDGP